MNAAKFKGALSPTEELPALLGVALWALRARLERTLSAFHAGAREEAARLWCEFDLELQAHLALEERYILPLLSGAAPEDAAAWRDEHAALRGRAERLGTGLELHLTREEAVAEFFAALSAHAVREERVLHGLTQDHIPERSRAAIRALLLDARRRFLAQEGARS